MKTYTLFAALAAVVVAGCGHKDETVVTGVDGSKMTIKDTGSTGGMVIEGEGKDGSKVTETVDGNSGVKIEGTGKDGTTYSQTTNAAGTTIQGTDKNGNKVSETINGNGMSASDGKGNSTNMGAGVVTESALGLPFYPGSEEGKDSGLSMKSEDPKAKSVISSRSTKDDPDKVIAFYKDKITGGQSSSANAGGTKVAGITGGKLSNGAEANVTAINDGKRDTVIMVTVKIPKS